MGRFKGGLIRGSLFLRHFRYLGRGGPVPGGIQDGTEAAWPGRLGRSSFGTRDTLFASPMGKIGRNQPCHCGSGLKFKKCHGRLDGGPAPIDFKHVLATHAAEERIRELQQGLGRPVIGAKVKDFQLVAVGNTVHWSKSWKTVPDFLGDYIKKKIGPAWGNAEIAKPLAERHPLMQWYDAFCRYQKRVITKPGEVHSSEITGVVACYLGVAYALYLLDHNVELQARLLSRLRDPGNFQGAYYELIVASILIRAGFTLTLEDETDPTKKHCEFAAVSKTGKRYWVEAKMRSVKGMLGRTALDGGSDKKPLARLIRHLNGALAKPANNERLIFIDLNLGPEYGSDGTPTWLGPAMKRLEKYERDELQAGVTAYVFVTNMAFHRQLDVVPRISASPFGLGLPDFNRPGLKRVTDAYRQKQKYIDAHRIGESIERYLKFPSTFDGGLPSEAYGLPTPRVKIGETYEFDGIGVATVTSATVNEKRKVAYIAVSCADGKSRILNQPMSDEALMEYSEFREAYFGRVALGSKNLKNEFELFEWFMVANENMPRDKMIAWFSPARNLTAELEKLSDEELRMAYCEGLIAAMQARKAKPQPAPEPPPPVTPADTPTSLPTG